MKWLLSLLVFSAFFNLSASESFKKFPKNSCSTSDISLRAVDLSYCSSRNKLKDVKFLGLSHHTIVITEDDKEISIGASPTDISISNLHEKFNLSIHEFFIALYEDNKKIPNIEKIRQAFDIDSNNPLTVFRKNDLYAFVILGTNVNYDRIYITKKNNDGIIYQITGEFDEKQSLEILASIQY